MSGTAGKIANKVDTSDDALFKNIRKLRSYTGASANTAAALADKIQEATKADPTTRARLMFGIMQQPAYQQLLKEDVNDLNKTIETEE